MKTIKSVISLKGDPMNALPSAPFPVEKVPEVDSEFPAADIIVCITAGIKADQFKPLVKVKPDGVGVAGLRLQDDGAPFPPVS